MFTSTVGHMRAFLRKFLGREKPTQVEQTQAVSFDDVTAWMAGEADEKTRAAIAKQLDDPASPTNQHLAKLADPHKHQSGIDESSSDGGKSGRSR